MPESSLPSILDPASPGAAAIAELFWLLFWLMLAIFLGVTLVLLVAYRRFRARPGNERGRLVHGHTRLEIAWTVAPALLLAVVFVLSMRVMVAVDAAADGAEVGDPVRVVVVGHEWWWEYRLPDLGVVTANELHLPVGRRVEMELRAESVIHSFWVPQLHGKRDLVPGQVNYLRFVPTREGVFHGACAEFCGAQHAWMRTWVVVESADAFADWVRLQSTDALPPLGALGARGRAIFFTQTCVSCHTIRGTGAVGGAGPDLTHVASRDYLAAGVLLNTPENMARWLSRPQEVKPGNHMPDPRLGPDEIAALVAYMEELR